MSARSQKDRKQKQKLAQLRKKRADLDRKQQPVMPFQIEAQQFQRLISQVPRAWPGEAIEDVAVFDDKALQQLTPELVDQVKAVREALEMICNLSEGQPLQKLAVIPRSSPLSEWRLFARGLVSWLDNDSVAASEAWKRLDQNRRPGRIATAMMNALHGELEKISLSAEREQSPSPDDGSEADWRGRLDSALLYHAKLLRRQRFDRFALRMAEAYLQIPEPSDDDELATISAERLRWLHQFIEKFRDSEPELTSALRRAALHRVYLSPLINTFELAIKLFEGPPHDPNHLLLQYEFFVTAEGAYEKRAEATFQRYITEDLGENSRLPMALRNAMLSCVYLKYATDYMAELAELERFSFLDAKTEAEYQVKVEEAMRKATEVYPTNRDAHVIRSSWFLDLRAFPNISKEEEKRVLECTRVAMEEWWKGLPDDQVPRLWLANYYLNTELLDFAKPHVDWLISSRHTDPRVRTFPWQWHVYSLSRLCRRKASLKKPHNHLEEIERLWPSWVSKNWLPYLKEAFAQRLGDLERAASEREAIRQTGNIKEGSLVDVCMTYAAAALVHRTPAELKTFRTKIEKTIKRIPKKDINQLFEASIFFWDMMRLELLSGALGKPCKQLADRLKMMLMSDRVNTARDPNDPGFQAALLICAQFGLLPTRRSFAPPKWFTPEAVLEHPILNAVVLSNYIRSPSSVPAARFAKNAERARDYAQVETHPYYKPWFDELAEKLEQKMRSQGSESEEEAEARQFNEMLDDILGAMGK